MTDVILGIDIGGTTVKIGFITVDGGIVHKWEIPTNTKNQGNTIVNDIWCSIKRKLKPLQIDSSSIKGIGVGAPGFIDKSSGTVYGAFNIGWDKYALVDHFNDISRLPTYIENDANLAALGEYWQGAGLHESHLITITLGTGIGGGIIINGEVLNGVNGSAGEIGHVTVDPNGFVCNCGRIGCLETIASASGMVRQAMELIDKNSDSPLAHYYRKHKSITAKDIFERSNIGDKQCTQIIARTTDLLGLALANVGTIINPSKVLIAGGVSNAGISFVSNIKKAFDKYALARVSENCEINLASLGNDAGIYGAAFLVQQKSECDHM